jgi:hypothetical protein
MSYLSHRLTVVSPFSEDSGAEEKKPPVKVDEQEIGLYHGLHEKLANYKLKEVRHDPRKRIIVRVESRNECGDRVVLFRRFIGVTKTDSQAYLAPRTFSALRSVHPGNPDNFPICVRAAPGLYGRLMFYWSHPDDAARVSYKLGMIGIVLALLAFVFDWKDIKETILCLLGS